MMETNLSRNDGFQGMEKPRMTSVKRRRVRRYEAADLLFGGRTQICRPRHIAIGEMYKDCRKAGWTVGY